MIPNQGAAGSTPMEDGACVMRVEPSPGTIIALLLHIKEEHSPPTKTDAPGSEGQRD
jgi:hypothetical protein